MADEDLPISIILMVAPRDSTEYHAVPIGGDLPTFAIRTTQEKEGVFVQISTGYPFTRDEAGLDNLATYFEMLASALSTDEFHDSWLKSIEGQS